MGKKQRTFADKIARGTGLRGEVCPKCGQVIRHIKVIKAARNEQKDSWRYIENIERVCKCNEQEILS